MGPIGEKATREVVARGGRSRLPRSPEGCIFRPMTSTRTPPARQSSTPAGPPAGVALTAQQIGRAGELLVQYRLLLAGVESAPLTTDAGVDLVAYAPGSRRAVSIQVKTNLAPKPGGGTGKAALDWWVPEDCPAELIALADLSEERVWLFTLPELRAVAQQRSTRGLHFYLYCDPTTRPRGPRRSLLADFEAFRCATRIPEFFGRRSSTRTTATRTGRAEPPL